MKTTNHLFTSTIQNRIIPIAAAFAVLCGACLGPNPLIDAGDSGSESGDETGGMTVMEEPDAGIWWCAEIPDPPVALAHFSPPTKDQEITDPESFSGQPSACRCAHPDLDDLLDSKLIQGSVEVTLAIQAEWDVLNLDGEGPLFFRDAIYEAVENRCTELADDQHPNRMGDNCHSALDKAEPDVTVIMPEGDCTAWATYGDGTNMNPLPADSWSDYFTLGTVISYSTSLDGYSIDGDFFTSLLGTPAWLIDDGAHIGHNGNDFQLYNVTAGTIVDALGIQTGDVPQTLNNIDVSTLDGAMEAWETLRTETEFELVLIRGTSTIELEYEVVYTH